MEEKKNELDWCNYATESDVRNAAGGDASDFAKETDLASLKPEVDNIDVVKMETVPTDK